MRLFSYFIPHIVARFTTKYNRDIRVLAEHGKYKLLANGSRQSGPYTRALWQHAFSAFSIAHQPDVRRILVLGVAGGDVIHMARAIYPDAHITGVDIDAVMIAIGKKYFQLGEVTDLTLVVADAQDFVKKTGTWDLILCDLHIGASIPPFMGEERFLRNLKKMLSPRGVLVINYLREFEYEKLADILVTKLREIFPVVRETAIYFNRFFYCALA